jgi:GxxExxY protein
MQREEERKGTELPDDELTGRVIGAAIEVHMRLGPGFLEYIYERALVIELVKRGISLTQQQEITLSYDGVEIGKHRLDLFVAGCLVVELKAVRAIDEAHIATVKSYLRAVGQEVGLLFNFSKATLEIKRIYLNRAE